MIDTAWKEWKARNPGAFHANGDVWTAPADERDGGPLKPVPYCKLLPEQAFPAAPFEPPPHTADPSDYPLVSAVLASRCAGMVLAPRARDLYEGLRADEPSPIHRAAIRTWLSDATVPEILEGLGAGVYSARALVHALHEHGGAGARFDLARTLNRYCLPEWRETRMREDPWHDER